MIYKTVYRHFSIQYLWWFIPIYQAYNRHFSMPSLLEEIRIEKAKNRHIIPEVGCGCRSPDDERRVDLLSEEAGVHVGITICAKFSTEAAVAMAVLPHAVYM
jgi:hypothetical protein